MASAVIKLEPGATPAEIAVKQEEAVPTDAVAVKKEEKPRSMLPPGVPVKAQPWLLKAIKLIEDRKLMGNIAAVELVVYLWLCYRYGHEELSPSVALDRHWHQLIMNPSVYYKVCKAIRPSARHVIDHDTRRQDDSYEEHARRYNLARSHRVRHFGQPYWLSIWPLEYDGEFVVGRLGGC